MKIIQLRQRAISHEIIEKSTGNIFNSKTGTIFESNVIGLIPSSNGNPGEKTARYYADKVNGTIFENTNKGVFGNYTSDISNQKLYKVAKESDIKTGKATIRTVLESNIIKEYDINIIKVNEKTKTKNILFEITDEELLSKTNGIVQGMSGSPILQNDYIIGAVTHVVIDSPNKGYGIFITNMLEEAEN